MSIPLNKVDFKIPEAGTVKTLIIDGDFFYFQQAASEGNAVTDDVYFYVSVNDGPFVRFYPKQGFRLADAEQLKVDIKADINNLGGLMLYGRGDFKSDVEWSAALRYLYEIKSGLDANLGTLNAIDDKTPYLGAAPIANSSPVNFATDDIVSGGGTFSALNTNLLTGTVSDWFDARDYNSVSVQIAGSAGISAGAVTFEQTNEPYLIPAGSNWQLTDDAATSFTVASSTTVAASATRVYAGSVKMRYVRFRISTAFVGGTVACYAAFSQLPYSNSSTQVNSPTAANNKAEVIGTAALGATPSGNPVFTAGVARTALPSVRGDNQIVAPWFDKYGRFVISTLDRSRLVGANGSTNGVTPVNIAPATATVFNDIRKIILTNKDTVTHGFIFSGVVGSPLYYVPALSSIPIDGNELLIGSAVNTATTLALTEAVVTTQPVYSLTYMQQA